MGVCVEVHDVVASMRPRHRAAEYDHALAHVVHGGGASMRPRHRAAEYAWRIALAGAAFIGFNEAAA